MWRASRCVMHKEIPYSKILAIDLEIIKIKWSRNKVVTLPTKFKITNLQPVKGNTHLPRCCKDQIICKARLQEHTKVVAFSSSG